MLYEPSQLGIVTSGIISATILFIFFCILSHRRFAVKKEKEEIALLTLFYFFSWMIAILIGQTVFKINLTPKLSQIALWGILLPYFANLFYYFFFGHPPINFAETVKRTLKIIFLQFRILYTKIFRREKGRNDTWRA